MYVYPRDYIGRKIIEDGIYEEKELNLLNAILSALRPRNLLDVGANIGNHSLAWARVCAHIYSFEPGIKAYALLADNIKINNLGEQISAFNFGLSSQNAVLPLYVNNSGNLGASSLHSQVKSSTAEMISLKVGDQVLADLDAKNIDFMKIDVEGHEKDVLLGLDSTIKENRPVVFIEWDRVNDSENWVANEAFMATIFPGYERYALIWNTSRIYWHKKSFGRIRRLLIRLFRTKDFVLRLFTTVPPEDSRGNLLLVPKEKNHVLSGVTIFH
jgi:FkbM family methyltransferase